MLYWWCFLTLPGRFYFFKTLREVVIDVHKNWENKLRRILLRKIESEGGNSQDEGNDRDSCPIYRKYDL